VRSLRWDDPRGGRGHSEGDLDRLGREPRAGGSCALTGGHLSLIEPDPAGKTALLKSSGQSDSFARERSNVPMTLAPVSCTPRRGCTVQSETVADAESAENIAADDPLVPVFDILEVVRSGFPVRSAVEFLACSGILNHALLERAEIEEGVLEVSQDGLIAPPCDAYVKGASGTDDPTVQHGP